LRATIQAVQYLWPFLKALLRHWWALMSSALFTALSLYVVESGKSNYWSFWASIVLAVILLMMAAFLAWKDEYVPNRHGPEILLEWRSHEHGWDAITVRNVGEATAFKVAILDFSWNALTWHRRIEFPSIDPNDRRSCEAQFGREIAPGQGEIGYLRGILLLPERPEALSISVGFENIHGCGFRRFFDLNLVQASENMEIVCKPGKLHVIRWRLVWYWPIRLNPW
jgi:hypothetical protein